MESVDGDERESLTTGSEEGKGTVLDWLVDGKSMGGGGGVWRFLEPGWVDWRVFCKCCVALAAVAVFFSNGLHCRLRPRI